MCLAEKQTVKEVLGKDVDLVKDSMGKVVQQMASELNLNPTELQTVADEALANLGNLTPEQVQRKMEELLSTSGGLDGQTMKMLEGLLKGSDVLSGLGALGEDKTEEEKTEKTDASTTEGTANVDSE